MPTSVLPDGEGMHPTERYGQRILLHCPYLSVGFIHAYPFDIGQEEMLPAFTFNYL
jgi:hypothetical protein